MNDKWKCPDCGEVGSMYCICDDADHDLSVGDECPNAHCGVCYWSGPTPPESPAANEHAERKRP